MSILTIGFLFLLIVLVGGVFVSTRWLLGFNKQIKSNREAGSNVESEFTKQIRGLYILNIVIYSVEIGLLGGLLTSGLFTIKWFGFGFAALILGFIYKRIDMTIRGLLISL